MLGNRERALEWSARALASAPDDPVHLYNVGCRYAMLRENALAMDMLEKAFNMAMHHATGWKMTATFLPFATIRAFAASWTVSPLRIRNQPVKYCRWQEELITTTVLFFSQSCSCIQNR